VDPVNDYTMFILDGPVDGRLPGGGGEQIVRYNINQDKFGIPAENVSTFSETNTRIYNGFEVSVNARLPRGGFLLGGVTTQRTATTTCDVANPNDLRFCDSVPPFRTLYKLSGAYTIPWDVQLSGSLQAVPGNDIDANFTFNSARAGVPITGGGNLTVNLVEPDTMFLDYQTQLDMRLSRNFRFGSGQRRVQTYVDIFNVLNASTVASVNQTFGSNWLRPLVVMQARRFQLGVRVDF
jgi:hypothetical protein